MALAAATDVPGAVAAPAAPSVRLAPGDGTVAVSVPLPEATPPGTYAVSLTASAGAPAVTRAGRATLVVTAAATDADGDGIEDRADACPGAPRGRFDTDRDGCVGPYRRIRVATSATWRVGVKGVELGSMKLKGLRPGARVRLRGAVRQTLTGPQPDARGQAPPRRAAAARQGLLGARDRAGPDRGGAHAAGAAVPQHDGRLRADRAQPLPPHAPLHPGRRLAAAADVRSDAAVGTLTS